MIEAAGACVALVVVLVVVGVDRRDAVTLGLYALVEDVVMLGNIAVIAALALGIAVVWWRARLDREHARRTAEAIERARVADARAAADAAIEDARRRAERDARRPAGDVLQDFARRGGRR